MKKKEEQLIRKVTDMIQKTREGKLHWDIQCQTTEYNDPAKKPVESSYTPGFATSPQIYT